MTDSSPTGLAILKAVRASLRLVSSSSELLTISQLLAVKHELCETFTVINAQIQVEQSDDRKVVIDLTDWESSSDEGKEDENEDASAVGGNESGNDPLPIPGPYPINPPDMDELPDYWYVVDRGTEVGIFTDNASSTRAITDVICGHRVRVKTWFDAATLYNKLYQNGDIVRVRV